MTDIDSARHELHRALKDHHYSDASRVVRAIESFIDARLAEASPSDAAETIREPPSGEAVTGRSAPGG